MDNTIKVYKEEKELREKRLAAYAEAIREKVENDSEQVIKELVEERYRQKKTQQEMADITGVRASEYCQIRKSKLYADPDHVREVCECVGETYRDQNM